MDAMQPVGGGGAGVAEGNALQGGQTLDHPVPRPVEMIALQHL